MRPRLWWTKPQGPDAPLKGSQNYNRGRRDKEQWRQAKFLFVMSDVDEDSGPFTFLPGPISDEIARARPGGYQTGANVSNEEIYRRARPADTMRLVGPPGIGLFVDACRCFHFGARARAKEQLMLMFQFVRPEDAPKGELADRSEAFSKRFGDDPRCGLSRLASSYFVPFSAQTSSHRFE